MSAEARLIPDSQQATPEDVERAIEQLEDGENEADSE